jgi:hypothetical protein
LPHQCSDGDTQRVIAIFYADGTTLTPGRTSYIMIYLLTESEIANELPVLEAGWGDLPARPQLPRHVIALIIPAAYLTNQLRAQVELHMTLTVDRRASMKSPCLLKRASPYIPHRILPSHPAGDSPNQWILRVRISQAGPASGSRRIYKGACNSTLSPNPVA